MSREKRLLQCSAVAYRPAPQTARIGGECCNYKSNYDARAKGWRCRVCGVVYARLPIPISERVAWINHQPA